MLFAPAMKLEPPFSFQTAKSRKVCWRSLQSVPKFKNAMWVSMPSQLPFFFSGELLQLTKFMPSANQYPQPSFGIPGANRDANQSGVGLGRVHGRVSKKLRSGADLYGESAVDTVVSWYVQSW